MNTKNFLFKTCRTEDGTLQNCQPSEVPNIKDMFTLFMRSQTESASENSTIAVPENSIPASQKKTKVSLFSDRPSSEGDGVLQKEEPSTSMSYKAKFVEANEVRLYPIWENKDAWWCWLDSTLCLLVHSKKLQKYFTSKYFERCQLKDVALAYGEAVSILNSHQRSSTDVVNSNLEKVREKTFVFLQPYLRCERGQEESPIFAFMNLLKENKYLNSLFLLKFSLELHCKDCDFKKLSHNRKTVVTIPSILQDFFGSELHYLTSCFRCKAPAQKIKLKFLHLPPLLLMHFVKGLPHNRISSYDFIHEEKIYRVRGFIQYKHKSHFIAWIRSDTGEQWMCCDDLNPPVQSFKSKLPDVPAAEIHIVMWELEETAIGEDDFLLHYSGNEDGTDSHSSSVGSVDPPLIILDDSDTEVALVQYESSLNCQLLLSPGLSSQKNMNPASHKELEPVHSPDRQITFDILNSMDNTELNFISDIASDFCVVSNSTREDGKESGGVNDSSLGPIHLEGGSSPAVPLKGKRLVCFKSPHSNIEVIEQHDVHSLEAQHSEHNFENIQLECYVMVDRSEVEQYTGNKSFGGKAPVADDSCDEVKPGFQKAPLKIRKRSKGRKPLGKQASSTAELQNTDDSAGKSELQISEGSSLSCTTESPSVDSLPSVKSAKKKSDELVKSSAQSDILWKMCTKRIKQYFSDTSQNSEMQGHQVVVNSSSSETSGKQLESDMFNGCNTDANISRLPSGGNRLLDTGKSVRSEVSDCASIESASEMSSTVANTTLSDPKLPSDSSSLEKFGALEQNMNASVSSGFKSGNKTRVTSARNCEGYNSRLSPMYKSAVPPAVEPKENESGDQMCDAECTCDLCGIRKSLELLGSPSAKVEQAVSSVWPSKRRGKLEIAPVVDQSSSTNCTAAEVHVEQTENLIAAGKNSYARATHSRKQGQVAAVETETCKPPENKLDVLDAGTSEQSFLHEVQNTAHSACNLVPSKPQMEIEFEADTLKFVGVPVDNQSGTESVYNVEHCVKSNKEMCSEPELLVRNKKLRNLNITSPHIVNSDQVAENFARSCRSDNDKNVTKLSSDMSPESISKGALSSGKKARNSRKAVVKEPGTRAKSVAEEQVTSKPTARKKKRVSFVSDTPGEKFVPKNVIKFKHVTAIFERITEDNIEEGTLTPGKAKPLEIISLGENKESDVCTEGSKHNTEGNVQNFSDMSPSPESISKGALSSGKKARNSRKAVVKEPGTRAKSVAEEQVTSKPTARKKKRVSFVSDTPGEKFVPKNVIKFKHVTAIFERITEDNIEEGTLTPGKAKPLEIISLGDNTENKESDVCTEGSKHNTEGNVQNFSDMSPSPESISKGALSSGKKARNSRKAVVKEPGTRAKSVAEEQVTSKPTARKKKRVSFVSDTPGEKFVPKNVIKFKHVTAIFERITEDNIEEGTLTPGKAKPLEIISLGDNTENKESDVCTEGSKHNTEGNVQNFSDMSPSPESISKGALSSGKKARNSRKAVVKEPGTRAKSVAEEQVTSKPTARKKKRVSFVSDTPGEKFVPKNVIKFKHVTAIFERITEDNIEEGALTPGKAKPLEIISLGDNTENKESDVCTEGSKHNTEGNVQNFSMPDVLESGDSQQIFDDVKSLKANLHPKLREKCDSSATVIESSEPLNNSLVSTKLEPVRIGGKRGRRKTVTKQLCSPENETFEHEELSTPSEPAAPKTCRQRKRKNSKSVLQSDASVRKHAKASDLKEDKILPDSDTKLQHKPNNRRMKPKVSDGEEKAGDESSYDIKDCNQVESNGSTRQEGYEYFLAVKCMIMAHDAAMRKQREAELADFPTQDFPSGAKLLKSARKRKLTKENNPGEIQHQRQFPHQQIQASDVNRKGILSEKRKTRKQKRVSFCIVEPEDSTLSSPEKCNGKVTPISH